MSPIPTADIRLLLHAIDVADSSFEATASTILAIRQRVATMRALADILDSMCTDLERLTDKPSAPRSKN